MAKTKLKTVYKLKWKNALKLLCGLAIVIAGVALVTGAFVVFRDRAITIDVTSEIKEKVNVTPIVDDENTKTVKPDSKLSKFDAYWDYIKLSMIDVDMAALKRMNSDSVGYIEIKGTDFSYPVVQGEKDFYRSHSFDKTENLFGWIYLDENADVSQRDTNTIIYGNKVWLGVLSDKLKALYKDDWKNNKDNYILKFTNSYYSGLYQIISVYETKNDEHLKTSFEGEDDIKKFITNSISSSNIKFKAGALVTDNFLTITTNSKDANIVVLAKLIKYREEAN